MFMGGDLRGDLRGDLGGTVVRRSSEKGAIIFFRFFFSS
jgi:hypothetical protein